MKTIIFISMLICLIFVSCNENTQLPVENNKNFSLYFKSTDWRIRYHIATSEKLTKSHLLGLAKDKNYLVRSQVPKNKNVDVEILEILAKDTNSYVCYQVAGHRLASPKALTILAKNSSSDVREAVARNNNSNTDILNTLSNDNSWKVRLAIADNNNAPTEILWQWYQSSYYFVKKELVYSLAQHHNVCYKFLLFLEEKGEQAMYNKIGQEIASYHNAHPLNLDFLSSSKVWEIRLEVASNIATPIEVLEKMISIEEDDDIKEQALTTLQEKQGK